MWLFDFSNGTEATCLNSDWEPWKNCLWVSASSVDSCFYHEKISRLACWRDMRDTWKKLKSCIQGPPKPASSQQTYDLATDAWESPLGSQKQSADLQTHVVLSHYVLGRFINSNNWKAVLWKRVWNILTLVLLREKKMFLLIEREISI